MAPIRALISASKSSWYRFFARQERALSRCSPSIPARSPVGGDDAMAGDREGDRIRGARARDGADRAAAAYGGRDLAVGARLAVRDRAQRLPHLPLERRRLHVERQIEARAPAVEMRED